MKKLFFSAFFGTVLFFTLSSCQCNKDKDNPEPEKTRVAADRYICPMDCENGKTYEKPGACPTCGMDLMKQ